MATYWLSKDLISHEKPECIKFNETVCLRSDKTILEVYSSDAVHTIKSKRIYNVDYYIPLLKSALQKAIRRKQTKFAVSISAQFLDQNPIEFLRRLVIYMMEDCYLMPNILIHVVYLMVACSCDYTLTEQDKEFCLDVVHTLCLCDYKDDLTLEDFDIKKIHTLDLSNKMNQAVVAIWIRSEYGGTDGDMNFLRSLCMRWIHRIGEGYEVEEELIKHNASDITFPLYYYEGVDFHCYPSLMYDLKKLGAHIYLTNEEFRTMMWYGQSCVNNRDWLFETDALNKQQKDYNIMFEKYKGVLSSIKPYLILYAKTAYKTKPRTKTIDEYFI
jgi:hypothetical protein